MGGPGGPFGPYWSGARSLLATATPSQNVLTRRWASPPRPCSHDCPPSPSPTCTLEPHLDAGQSLGALAYCLALEAPPVAPLSACSQNAAFEFYDPSSPIYTSPRFLPPAKVRQMRMLACASPPTHTYTNTPPLRDVYEWQPSPCSGSCCRDACPPPTHVVMTTKAAQWIRAGLCSAS